MTDIWEALTDPTRRAIVARLAEGELSAGEIAARFDIARPGVSRHLRVLLEAGVAEVRQSGRQRVYSLAPGALDDLDAWTADVRRFWNQRLDALATEVARGKRRPADGMRADGIPETPTDDLLENA